VLDRVEDRDERTFAGRLPNRVELLGGTELAGQRRRAVGGWVVGRGTGCGAQVQPRAAARKPRRDVASGIALDLRGRIGVANAPGHASG
jgi:hypothetical protein